MDFSVGALAGRMRFKHFKLLTAIDDEGSLVRAAEIIAFSQPGATRMLQEIEDVIGQKMFDRTNRGLAPNEVGRCVIRYSRLMLSNLDGMYKDLVGVSKGNGGFLSIGAVMGAVPMVARRAALLTEDLPDLKVQVRQATSSELLNMLEKGVIELAVCRTSVSSQPDAYRVWQEIPETVSVVASAQHPKARAASVALKELEEFPWLVCLPDMPMRRHFEREFINASLHIPSNIVESASTLAVMVMLKQRPNMCSMQPSEVVQQLLSTGEIVRLDVPLTTKSEAYQVVSHQDRDLSNLAQMALSAPF